MQSDFANFTKQVGYHDIDSNVGAKAMPLTNEDLVALDQLMNKDYKTDKRKQHHRHTDIVPKFYIFYFIIILNPHLRMDG